MTAPTPDPSAPRPAVPSHSLRRVPRFLARIFRSSVGAATISVVTVASVAVVTTRIVHVAAKHSHVQSVSASGAAPIGTYSNHHVVITLPDNPDSYLGAFVRGVPQSYAPIESFVTATGVHPNIALYYSSWYEKFQSAFAIQAADKNAIPFVQIDPSGVNLAAIAAGQYDTYLKVFATAVAGYGAHTGHGLIIGFGHEVNGHWYSWGYRHTSPAVFVAAWRHVVNVFRQQGADDVTWLWTVNIIDTRGGIPNPAPWWPGSSYVTWVGIDGYYYKRSWTFAPLFGPTINAVRALSRNPIHILIAETGASPAAGQPAKIVDLYAGVHNYGLLGFVWFDANGVRDWSLSGPASFAAFRQGAETYVRPAS